MRLPILLGVLMLVGAGAAWAYAVVAPTFSVSGWQEAPKAQREGTPNCSTSNDTVSLPPTGSQHPNANGTATCTIQLSLPSTSYGENASVSEGSASLSGSVTASCTTSKSGSKTVVWTFVNGNGSGGPQTSGQVEEKDDCTAQMAFTDDKKSTLDLSLHADDTTAAGTGNLVSGGTVTGTITSGTGAYAGDVGSWSQSEGAYRVLALLAGNPKLQWHAHLHKGATLVAIAYPYPGSTITKQFDAGLRIVSAPHVACTATATSGGTKVKLGSKTTPATGSELLVTKLTSVLKPGSWTLSVVCGHASTKGSLTVSS